MIAIDELIRVVAGDADRAEEERVETHVLGCDACARIYERLAELGVGIAALVRRGALATPVTAGLLAALRAGALVTRGYRVPAGGAVACTVGADDLLVATELEADLAGVARVDLVLPDGGRLTDVPFDAAAGAVAFVTGGEELRALPSGAFRLALIAVDADGERRLGAYTLDHTAFAG